MRTRVSSQEIERYQHDGFLVMEDFLDAGEVQRWSQVVEEAMTERLARNDGLSNERSDDYYKKVFTQVSGLTRIDARVGELLLDPAIGKVAASLAGVDGIRLWNDQALFKPPFGNPTAWHFDAPYWSFTSRDAITIWIALDDATVENGCMWYLPGSQRTAGFEQVAIGSNLAGLFDHYPHWRSLESVPASVRAGGAVWHNGLIAHAAGANMTRGSRRAMTCAYMPDGVVYNGFRDEFVLPEEYAASLRVGDPLDSDQYNPLVWAASGAAAAR
jgi:phytanoyl-CoA hydroxylase